MAYRDHKVAIAYWKAYRARPERVEKERIRKRNWKKLHPDKVKESHKLQFSRRKAMKHEIALTARLQPCQDCGVSYPPCVMDFHHARGKSFDVSTGENRHQVSVAKFLEEIAKCDVLCANCHRLRHGVTQ